MTDHPFAEGLPMHSRGSEMFRSLRRRLIVSLTACVGWVSLTLLCVAFWATGFSLFQDFVVVVVSLLVLSAVLVGTWVMFGLRFASRWLD
ncbi:MAG: hypothetical protein WBF81_01590 [Thermoplasmata archaeon]